jgi:hypothetical protein
MNDQSFEEMVLSRAARAGPFKPFAAYDPDGTVLSFSPPRRATTPSGSTPC